MGIPMARRRTGYWFRYHTEFVDSQTIAVYEVPQEPKMQIGDMGSIPKSRTHCICMAHVSNLQGIEDLCEQWNADNAEQERALFEQEFEDARRRCRK